jgi:hypothetical protein
MQQTAARLLPPTFASTIPVNLLCIVVYTFMRAVSQCFFYLLLRSSQFHFQPGKRQDSTLQGSVGSRYQIRRHYTFEGYLHLVTRALPLSQLEEI